MYDKFADELIAKTVSTLEYAVTLQKCDIYSASGKPKPKVGRKGPKYSDFAFDLPDGKQVRGKIPYLVYTGKIHRLADTVLEPVPFFGP